MLKFSLPQINSNTITTNNHRQPRLINILCNVTLYTLLFVICIFATGSSLLQLSSASFVDSSPALKPSIVLILPQSFKVPINQESGSYQSKLQQYVAVVNNIHNSRDDLVLRQQYKKLSLQVRDAKAPISGQLFYEHVFDYFGPNAQDQHLLIPVNLDQVSPTHEQLGPPPARSYVGILTGASTEPPRLISRPQQLIVSIRPYQLDSGFGSDSVEFVSSAPVHVEPVPSNDGRRSFAVVQTDKPIYKPEDKVRIRCLVVNENLRPVIKDELRLQVKNPHKVIVEEIRFPNANYNSSTTTNDRQQDNEPLYLDHVFQFPPEPMLGTWSVHLLHNDPIANDTTSFEVKEYVLPTYEIEFEAPSYILPGTETISGSIVAKYHHGKPVQGKAQFKFGYKESVAAKPIFIARSTIKTVDSNTGRVDFKISSEKFKETGWFPNIAGSRLVVEATVTEMTTGHLEVAQDTSCLFISLPFKISFEDSIEDFKPGLSQQLTVQALEVQTQRPAPKGMRVIAQYRGQNGTLLSASERAANNQPVDFRQVLDVETYTDASGRATFNVGPIRDDITSIMVTIRLLNSTQSSTATVSNELAVGHHTLSRHESLNGWISFMNKSITYLNIGDQFVSDLLIRDAVVIPQKIYYTIIARGQILTLNRLNSDGLVKFTITDDMMPSIRVVLFALTQDSVGLLSDSMRINIGQDLNCGLQMRYKSNSGLPSNNETTLKPNDRGKLAINARQGDLVSLIGVDSAVYTLNNRSKLDSSRIVQRIKRLDSGCGFGGGRNNLDVFHNAGLMYIKDGSSSSSSDQTVSQQLGSSCLTVVNQLKHLEDIHLGYARPMFAAATQINRPRALELALAVRQKIAASSSNSALDMLPSTLYTRNSRKKREIETEPILRRYKDPLHRACCRLGTLEDLPQQRNCSVRARIVEKYMRKVEFRSCSMIYFDCCRAIYGEQLLLGSVLSARTDFAEPIIETRIVATHQSPQFSESVIMANAGHLDRIEAQSLIRKDFRETWLFDIVSVDEADGSASLDVQLPHSITSWSISAMALNRYQPMCVMPKPLKLTTFQEIFLQVSMPYKVIQGEQIDLVATIFNYSPLSQDVYVYMYGVEDVCSEAEPGERSDRKRLRLDKHASQSILFPMIPLKTGKYPIKIVAITPASGSSDIVERELNVVPRGKPVTDETTFSLDPMNHQRRSKRAIQTGNLVDEIDSSKGLQRSKVRLTPSRDSEYIVPQTQECIVSAIGDRLGQSVQTTMIDVESLIRLPHGCGEQVMIYLGPTLYTTRYLSSINKLTGDLRWRAIRYIQSGYKRILNYRKENGAFSAFPRRDPSIWLTAFVAKMLCQTERTPFVAEEIHVDKTVVNSALNWIIDSQNKETGTWIEMNPVYHREMLGGVLKENALTAFVTMTLNECAHHSPDLIDEQLVATDDKVKSSRVRSSKDREDDGHQFEVNGIDKLKVATQKAEQALMLDRYKAVKERNPYVLALTAYALSYSRSRDAAETLNDLMMFAEQSQSRNQIYWRGDYPIETAAYALQAIIELAPVVGGSQNSIPTSGSSSSSSSRSSWMPGADAVAISNWLASRRSYSGAFESTQDTVVGLEALSKFAQLQATPNGQSLIPQTAVSRQSSLMCNVTINNRTRRSIEFGKDNAQILQTFKLESMDIASVDGEMLDIVTSGNGLGTMSVKLKYNVFQEEDELCRFNIDSSIEEWQPKLPLYSTNNRYSEELVVVQEDPKKEQPNDTKHSSPETIEEDYFKSFDKSMLSELNLVDLNQLDMSTNSNRPPSPQVSNKKRELRLKRSAHMMDLSQARSDNSASAAEETWTSRVVSSFKAKLPSWLAPKSTTTTTTTTSAPMDTSRLAAKPDTPRRNNTSRRSTQTTPVPLIVHPTGIPIGVKLNTLSQSIELGDQNGTKTSNQSTTITNDQQIAQQVLANPSSRLVLLLKICVHHLSIRRDSETAVIEIGILSGFKPNEADLKEIMKDPGIPALKYEISADRSLVIIYMHYIPFSGPCCIQFRLVRDSLVYNLQSGYIRAYEYYSPTHSCSNFYTPTRQMDLIETKCDSSGQVCQCAAKSFCPASNKLLDLGEIQSVNATRARQQLTDLVCSNRFDLVSLVRLKSVRHLEAGKMFKLSVKVKSDLRGNLSQIIDLQRQQKSLTTAKSIRKPTLLMQPSSLYISSSNSKDGKEVLAHGADPMTDITSVDDDAASSSLDLLNLNIDSSCVRNDPLLLHLAHPNQWKQGGELMILFAKSSKLEKRFFRVAPTKLSSAQLRSFPKPKASTMNSSETLTTPKSSTQNDKLVNEAQMAALTFDSAQQLQYSTTLLLDKDSILHDLVYQSKVELRETINNLIMWLELRARREKWTCPTTTTTTTMD